MSTEKLEYTLKAGVGGAGLGIAAMGGASFFMPLLSLTTPIVISIASVTALIFSCYTYQKAQG
ncbi:hypothetical protein ACWU4D_04425 [Vibrio sp. WJH972]